MSDTSRPSYYNEPPLDSAGPTRRLPAWLLPAVGVAFALGVGVILYRGCGVEPTPPVDSGDRTRAAQNPWPTVLTDLRRQSDAAGCRATLDRLDDALALNKSPELQPASLSPDAAAELQRTFQLTDAEVGELRPANYTPLDAHYLADCLYFREVARSLDVAKRPPLERVALAFELVNRQVADRPWILTLPDGRGRLMPPVPPTLVVNRGGGTTYERGVVFLALVRQLGFDGCFVGPAGAAAKTFETSLAGKGVPGGPMWGVGVRVGGEIFLFDPVRQKPFPGGGDKPATLAQLQANLTLLKPWRDDKADPWAVPDADITGAVVYPYVEFSALAPRMRRLEIELKSDAPPVQLAQTWPELAKRFAAPSRVVEVWNPKEPFTPLRGLSAFLPPKEGGLSPVPDLPTQFQLSMVPATLLGAESLAAGVQRLRVEVVSRYAAAFIEPPAPKSRVARGQFTEVVPALVAKLSDYQAAQDRLRAARQRDPAAIDEFLKNLAAVEAKKRLARDKERDAVGPLTQEARQAEVELYKSGGAAAEAIVNLALAEVGAAEATFLIALAMHEQAERAQSRAAGDAAARRAWAEAGGWWARYAPYETRFDPSFPGRAAQVKALRARAEKLAG